MLVPFGTFGRQRRRDGLDDFPAALHLPGRLPGLPGRLLGRTDDGLQLVPHVVAHVGAELFLPVFRPRVVPF